jgi:hypothetical protein
VEAHGEGWPAVAAHVGTKSQLQCAMRFLQVTGTPLAAFGLHSAMPMQSGKTPSASRCERQHV